MKYYVDNDTLGTLVTNQGTVVTNPIQFHLDSLVTYTLEFNAVDAHALTPVDVSASATWTAVLGAFGTNGAYVHVDNSSIDKTNANLGVIKITVDCSGNALKSAIGSKDKIKCWFQISGWNGSSKKIVSHMIKAECYNTLTETTPTT